MCESELRSALPAGPSLSTSNISLSPPFSSTLDTNELDTPKSKLTALEGSTSKLRPITSV